MSEQSAAQTAEQSVRQKHPGGNPAWVRGVNGRRWARERAQETARFEEAERQAEAEALLADLGRTATAFETVLIEQASALIVEGRKLRQQGRSSADCSRLLSRIIGQLGIVGTKPAERQVDTFANIVVPENLP